MAAAALGRTCCLPTRCSTPVASARWRPTASGSPWPSTRRETIEGCRGRRRQRGADRRERRPAALRLRPVGRRAAGGPGQAVRPRGARRDGLRGPRGRAGRRHRARRQVRGLDGTAARRACRRRRRDDLGRRHRHLCDQHVGERDPGRLVRSDGHRLRQARPAVPAGRVRARHGDLELAAMVGGRRRAQSVRNGPRPAGHRRRRARGLGGLVLLGRAHHVLAAAAGRGPGAAGARRTSTRPWPTTTAPTWSRRRSARRLADRLARLVGPGPADDTSVTY